MHISALLSPLLAAGTAGAAAIDKPPLTEDGIERAIDDFLLDRTIIELGNVTFRHGGNRATGSDGDSASREYLVRTLQSPPFADAVQVRVEPFGYVGGELRGISLTDPDGRPVYVGSPAHNAPVDGNLPASGPLYFFPAHITGCCAGDWLADSFTGKVPILQLGRCDEWTQRLGAMRAGARAILFYNDAPGVEYGVAVPAQVAYRASLIPAGIVTREVAHEWRKRWEAQAQATPAADLVVALRVDMAVGPRTGFNVIAETRQGDGDNVVMLGAHLDSVPAGPGINDNGSGVAALVAIMHAASGFSFKNKLRFAFWGGKELGLIGSSNYTRSLPAREANKIRAYYNYDTIASAGPKFAIGTDTAADDVVAAPLVEYLTSWGTNVRVYDQAPTRTWDWTSFFKLGIPTSGLFTGFGRCFHQVCDTAESLDRNVLAITTRAAARAAARFAISLDGVPRRNEGRTKSLSEANTGAEIYKDRDRSQCGESGPG